MEHKVNKQEWDWHPKIPINNNPLFSLPINLKKIIKWYKSMWLTFSETIFCFVIAMVSWFFLQPSLEFCKEIYFSWIIQMFLRNFGIIFVVAGGLHLYFYTLRKQKNNFRYDSRDFTSGKRFILNDQVLDNMFWTLVSGVTIWTAYEILFIWSYTNEIAPLLIWHTHPVWFCTLFFLIVMWKSIHFYFVHRLLHWPFFFKLVHFIHHRNINTSPRSGISIHPIEHLLYFSSVLIHFIIPSHPLHVLFHMTILTIGAVIGHYGFDSILINKKNKVALGHFHHQLHHHYFECNHGTI